MKEIEKVAADLFDKIRSRFEDISLGDDGAKATTDPEQARFFNFDFEIDGKSYGNITISIAESSSVKVYFSKNISEQLPEELRQDWYDFLRDIRFFAKRNMMSFDTRDIARSSLTQRDIQTMAKTDGAYDTSDISLAEGRMYGTSRSSYERMGPTRIIIRHSAPVNDEVRGSRTRHINSIYVETADGERFKMPFNHVTGARAMARHLQHGGMITDEIGSHIVGLVNEMNNLKVFVRNTRGRMFEDAETSQMVEAAIEYYGNLHERLHKLKGKRTYESYVDTYQPESIDDSDYDENDLKERFTRKLFDERMSSALNSVYKAYKMKKSQIPETAIGAEFEEWADNVVEQGMKGPSNRYELEDLQQLLSEPIPYGVDGDNAIGSIQEFINDDGLFDELFNDSEFDPEMDARPTILRWIEDNDQELYSKLDGSDFENQDDDLAPMEEVDRYDKQSDFVDDVTDPENNDRKHGPADDSSEVNDRNLSFESLLKLAGLR